MSHTIKVIISHDVDHLLVRDHVVRDLILPKLAVRSVLQMMGVYGEKITAKECIHRCGVLFKKSMNHIPELCQFDNAHGVPSTFFFGMASGLGMSYSPTTAKPYIEMVKKYSFHAGVHGICYDSDKGIEAEANTFKNITGASPCGIRMHYVRFDDSTFERLSHAGYIFDSTEFNKREGCCIKAPYKVNGMWEFPLTIMDGYLPYSFAAAKERTLELLAEAEARDVKYISVLFHDYMFCDAWGETQKWYKWLVSYFKENNYEMVSFEGAINELESKTDD